MYTERDRVSTTQIVVTLVGIVVGIVAVFSVASVLLGALIEPTPMLPPVEAQPAEVVQVPDTTAVAVAPATVAPPAEPPAAEPPPAAKPEPDEHALPGTVVIDAGHQKRGDSSQEPIGPGAAETKPRVAGGTSGVVTRNSESSINLKVAKRLQDELESRGVKVIMVRTKQDVNVANSKRARIANEANADLFIRLHCDGNGNHGTRGLSTLIPAKNRWTGSIVSESKTAGRYVHDAVIESTGATDRGLVKRSDLSGFNWAKVPTVLVEMGFMSNSAEDRKLDSAAYQKKLADGMASGIMRYLESK